MKTETDYIKKEYLIKQIRNLQQPFPISITPIFSNKIRHLERHNNHRETQNEDG